MSANDPIQIAARAPVVFFDGECPLCHSSVAFLLRFDRVGALHFAPLRGPLAASLLPEELREVGPDATIVLRQPDGQIHVRAAAIGAAMGWLPAPWKWLAKAVHSPGALPVLNWIYRGIARRRDAWFGRYDECPLPPPAWRKRFLP